jgi:hydroxymethylglutaryl-CoA lyase
MLEGLGFDTGVDIDALAQTGEWISEKLGRPNNSRAGRAVAGSRRGSQDASR